MENLFKFFASLKLAVIVMLSMGVLSAIGTIVEAQYDAQYAQKFIYHSPWMYAIMALLCVNLLNVIIDRYPWKKRHTGFILAHVGIIVLVAGSLVSRIYGIDGSMMIDIGQKSRRVTLPETVLYVGASYGESFTTMNNSRVDFLLHPPEKTNYEYVYGQDKIKVLQYYHFALRDEKILPSESLHDGPAVRFQLKNPNVNVTNWIVKSATDPYDVYELGPASVFLTSEGVEIPHLTGNALVLRTTKTEKLKYEIYTKSKSGLTKKGVIQAGERIETGWMGLEFTLINYLPKAERKVEYVKRDKPSGVTVPAIQIEFNGKKHWLGLNSSVKLFTDLNAYLVSFHNAFLMLDFDVELKKFNIGRYQGTNKAMSYESEVFVEGVGNHTISMNEPLKHNSFTFYQASFQENDQGEPTTSIFSVNRDPGRFWKYLGSLLIVLGTIFMFYFKQKIFAKKTEEE